MAGIDIARYLANLSDNKKNKEEKDKYGISNFPYGTGYTGTGYYNSPEMADYMDPNMQQGIDVGSYLPPRTSPPIDTNPAPDYADTNIQQGIDMGSYLPPRTTPPVDTDPAGDYVDTVLRQGGDPVWETGASDSVVPGTPYRPSIPRLDQGTPYDGTTGTASPPYSPSSPTAPPIAPIPPSGQTSQDTTEQVQGSDMYSWIDEYYKSAREVALSNLQRAYQDNLEALEQERASKKGEYYDIKNKQDARNIINARKLEEMLAYRGYAIGDQVKTSTGLLAQRMGDLASLERQEQGAYDTIDREKTKLARNLASDMNVTLNENNLKKFETYIDQYNKNREFEVKEAGITGYYNGQPTLESLKMRLGAEQWNVEMQQRAYEFANNYNLKATAMEWDQAVATAQLALQEGRLELDTYKFTLDKFKADMANNPNSLENKKKLADYESSLLTIEKKRNDLISNNAYISQMKKFIEDNFYESGNEILPGLKLGKALDLERAAELRAYIGRQVNNGYISQTEANELLSLYNQEIASSRRLPRGSGTTAGGVMGDRILDSLEDYESSISGPDTAGGILPVNIADFDVEEFERDLKSSDNTGALLLLNNLKSEILDKYGEDWWFRWLSLTQ